VGRSDGVGNTVNGRKEKLRCKLKDPLGSILLKERLCSPRRLGGVDFLHDTDTRDMIKSSIQHYRLVGVVASG
jgi:hypothetical protein